MYTKKELEQIHANWKRFILHEDIDLTLISSDVYQSWLRSREYGIDPYNSVYVECSEKELAMQLEARADLISISRPYLQKLEEIVNDSQFIVVLTDENGIVLASCGDKNLLDRPEASKPGADRSEKAIGCNAIGTALHNNRPIQIWGTENYNMIYQSWTCSAAPIHDENGEIIGAVDLSGVWEKAHQHTLGMVIATADAIERQMKLEKEYMRNQYIQNLQNATLSTIKEGIIVIDTLGHICQINSYACSLLGIPSEEECIGRLLQTVTNWSPRFIDYIIHSKQISNEEVEIRKDGFHFHCYLSSAPFHVNNKTDGIVIVLRDEKQVKKLINHSIGSYASVDFDTIIGHSVKLQEVIRIAKKAALSSSSVLLLGESGTGKEMFAQAIHNYSARAEHPFIDINCGALPRNLIESELFGYEGGAFTGSKKSGHMGKFELADGGTLFLDEIGDMPFDLQVTLLRVLQNQEVVRIGGHKGKRIDVRIIAATNSDIEAAILNHTFRKDLYYRLNVFTLKLPPLRERKEDIEEITEHFIKKYNIVLRKNVLGIRGDALKKLYSYSWPGNIRELENVIERAMNLTDDNWIKTDDLLVNEIKGNVPQRQIQKSLIELTREKILSSLEENKGNIRATAMQVGVSRSTLYRMLEKFGIDIEMYR